MDEPKKNKPCPIDLCEARIQMVVKRIDIRLDGMDKALELKADELERRLEELNHWKKEALRDRQHLVGLSTYTDKINQIDKDTRVVEKSVTKLEEHYNNRITLSTIVAIFAVIIALASLLHRVWPI